MPLKLDLCEKRMKLSERAKELLTKCDSEKRAMSAEELTNINACHDEIDDLAKQIAVLDRQERQDKEISETRMGPRHAPEQPGRGAGGDQRIQRAAAIQKEFRNFLLGGVQAVNDRSLLSDPTSADAVPVPGIGFRVPLLSESELRTRRQERLEKRAVGESGISGYGVSEGFQIKLWDTLKSFASVRAAPISYESTEQGNNLPELVDNDTSNQGALLTENTQTASNVDASFTQVTLGAYMFSSNAMLFSLQALQDIEALEEKIGWFAGVRIGRVQGSYFTTGTGSGQPYGILQAAINAVGTYASLLVQGTSVGSGGGGPTGWVYNDVINLEHSIDPAYRDLRVGGRKACGFMFNDSTLRQTKLIKDSQGRPLWLAGFTALGGEAPDTIDGFPFYINQYMPSFGTTGSGSTLAGNYPALFAHFPSYKVRDVKEITLLRLVERYADYLQVGYIGFLRSDARLLQQNAVGVYQNSAT